MNSIQVPFLDLSVSGSEKEDILGAIENVLDHGMFIMGHEHEEFELEIAETLNRKYAIAVGSGTDALYLTFKCLGIKEGDEVITTPLSWIASVNSFSILGAKPVFADIDIDLNLDPNKVETLITENTKAILAVDYAGLPCDYNTLTKIASKYNIYLIEDGSQALGATYKGAPVGSFGFASCISLNPMKSLAACGEAGVIATDDKQFAEDLKVARYNGMVNKETCIMPGVNGRMDTIQAAILLQRMKTFRNKIALRQRNANFYNEQLKDVVDIPIVKDETEHAQFLYLIGHDKRDQLHRYLLTHGVESRLRDNILISSQPAYENSRCGDIHLAELLVKKKLAIPIHEKLSHQQLSIVVDLIKRFVKEYE